MTNGRRTFAIGGDGRGAWSRRWRDIVELHIADCGGATCMSEAQLSLARRAATLEIELEQLEARMSEGKPADIEVFARTAGHLRRLLESLGLKRKTRSVQSLESYIAKRGRKAVIEVDAHAD